MSEATDNSPPATELDPGALAAFVRVVGPEGATELIKALLAELPVRLGEIQQGARDNDLALARQSAHKLKSTVAYVGGRSLSKLCSTLEQHAREGEAGALRENVPMLESRLKRLARELSQVRL